MAESRASGLTLSHPSPTAMALRPDGPDLLTTMMRRRSIKRLRAGPFSDAALDRILEAVRLAPAAFNQPPWRIVVVRQRLPQFWDVVAGAVRERLDGDRQTRYLDRIDGFRPGVATVLVYEAQASRTALQDAWGISPEQAASFAEQGLGMVQLALWLAITGEGLSASLQHWEWLVEQPAAAFLGVPAGDFRLMAMLPIGYADELPPPPNRPAVDDVVSIDRFG